MKNLVLLLVFVIALTASAFGQTFSPSFEAAQRQCEVLHKGRLLVLSQNTYIKPVFDQVLMQEVIRVNPILEARAVGGSHTFRFPEVYEGEYFCIPRTALSPNEIIGRKAHRFRPIYRREPRLSEEEFQNLLIGMGVFVVLGFLLGLVLGRVKLSR